MPSRGLYARTAARGFPVFDRSGQSGQGHLPDSTRPGAAVPGEPSGQWTDPNADPGSVPATPGPPQEFIAGGLWGLSGSMNPDRTPRGHAAPLADPSLPIGEYYAEADAAHAADFGAYSDRLHLSTKTHRPLDHVYAQGSGPSHLEPLAGQIRSQAGFDGVQGYGGGGDGPRGVNASMPITVDQRNYPGQFYAADQYVHAAEAPFLVPETAQFIPAAPELGPWLGGMYDAPTASVHAQDIVTGDSPAQGAPVSQGQPAYLTSFWR